MKHLPVLLLIALSISMTAKADIDPECARDPNSSCGFESFAFQSLGEFHEACRGIDQNGNKVELYESNDPLNDMVTDYHLNREVSGKWVNVVSQNRGDLTVGPGGLGSPMTGISKNLKVTTDSQGGQSIYTGSGGLSTAVGTGSNSSDVTIHGTSMPDQTIHMDCLQNFDDV